MQVEIGVLIEAGLGAEDEDDDVPVFGQAIDPGLEVGGASVNGGGCRGGKFPARGAADF